MHYLKTIEPAELTVQEAADLLNVSSAWLMHLLDEQKIPCSKGRCILLQDVMDYKTKIDSARRTVLDELTEEAQKLSLGY
jgi:excisionase family DNA binding protein